MLQIYQKQYPLLGSLWVHNAEGIAKVIPLQDGSSILRLENLHVTNGPDLYVYLSPDTSDEDFVNIGTLKVNNGNQNYEIHPGTDLSKYESIDLV